MSVWSKIGNFLKKAAPIAAAAIPFVPSISNAIGGLFGGGGAQSSPVSSGDVQSYPLGGSPPPSPNTDSSLLNGISSAVSSLLNNQGLSAAASGAINYAGVRETNAANAKEAAINRDFEAQQAQINRSFQSDQAQRQMNFQASQTGTEMQRRVADLQKAGLNPMLAYSSGAGSGGGAAGSGSMAGGSLPAPMQNALGAGANSALSAAQTVQELQRNSVMMDQARAQADLLRSQSKNVDAQTSNEILRSPLLREGLAKMQNEKYGIILSNDAAEVQNRILKATADYSINSARSAADIARNRAELYRLEIPKAHNEAEAQGSWWKRNVTPYMSDIGSLMSGAVGAGALLH